MLITDGNLNIQLFKELVPTLTWKIYPRQIGTCTQHFYITKYEDEEKIIEVSIRPSLRAQIIETFKNRTPTGNIPPSNYNGPLVEYGSSVEIIIDNKFLDKIKSLAKVEDSKNTQVISWD